MSHTYYETIPNNFDKGISIAYYTTPGNYHPFHWYEELEILYPLNGKADITISGQKYCLLKKQPLVIESGQTHSVFGDEKRFVFFCVHITKKI